MSHYGNIELIKVEDAIVEVKLLGACSGCPSADITQKYIIEDTLKEELSWVESVEIIREVNQDLINMAKKILSSSK